ncbi:CHRD domain-containing protein [Actinacidiphila alni]|uniref:CHRD domain-containing protein n=1 Tax=Actinacidiphila alni TaxID=380248 RepID=UPI001FE83486|nr:CHRD domain-containing protein [Actinacidiphila alni]
MRKRLLALAAAGAALTMAGISPAYAHDGHDGHGGDSAQSSGSTITTRAQGKTVFLGASLSGAQEVSDAGAPGVGDSDGKAVALVRVKGDRVTFALQWKGIGAPTLGHIHAGNAGTNGDVKVKLFLSPMPDTVNAAAGQTTVEDPALAAQLRSNPKSFYVNLHSKEFPKGAVRGQLQKLSKAVNPLDIIDGGKLRALADGSQEVPKDAKSKVGDPDGRAVAFLHPNGTEADYSMAWVNIEPPILGHIHKGVLGKNGDVQVPLFKTPVPDQIFAISGAVPDQDPAVLQRIAKTPSNYYANIHTDEFSDGAVRGQLFDGRKGQDDSGQEDNQGGDNGQNNGGQNDDQGNGNGNQGADEPKPVKGNILLFDDPGTFSEDNASQGVSGEGCQNVGRPGIASALQVSQPVKIWSGRDCTGESKIVNGNILDLGTIGFDDKISSVFFGEF